MPKVNINSDDCITYYIRDTPNIIDEIFQIINGKNTDQLKKFIVSSSFGTYNVSRLRDILRICRKLDVTKTLSYKYHDLLGEFDRQCDNLNLTIHKEDKEKPSLCLIC